MLRFEATRDDLFGRPDRPAGGARRPEPLVLVAACALIDVDGRVLLARRPEGKTMAGPVGIPRRQARTRRNAGSGADPRTEGRARHRRGRLLPGAFAFASHAYERFHLLMPLYLCRRWNGTAARARGPDADLGAAGKLADYQMPPADKPLVPLLRDFL